MNEMTNVTTGEVRFSYTHLFKPYAAMQGQEEKFSTTILVPKADTDTMARVNAAIEAAKQRGMRKMRSSMNMAIISTTLSAQKKIYSVPRN